MDGSEVETLQYQNMCKLKAYGCGLQYIGVAKGVATINPIII